MYIYTGWPTKMSLFIFGDNVYKNKDTFSQTAFHVPPSENSQAGWDLGNGMERGYRFDAKWVCFMGSYAWRIQVICSRNEVAPHFLKRTLEYLRHNLPWDRLISGQTDNPWSSYFQDLNPRDYFLRWVPECQSLWKPYTDKRGHYQERN